MKTVHIFKQGLSRLSCWFSDGPKSLARRGSLDEWPQSIWESGYSRPDSNHILCIQAFLKNFCTKLRPPTQQPKDWDSLAVTAVYSSTCPSRNFSQRPNACLVDVNHLFVWQFFEFLCANRLLLIVTRNAILSGAADKLILRICCALWFLKLLWQNYSNSGNVLWEHNR